MRWCNRIAFLLICLTTTQLFGQTEHFSGPQIDEKLPSFEAMGLAGKWEDKGFDITAIAQKKPIAIIFFHERTRPAFGLARAVTMYTSKHRDKLSSAVVFLTDDPTATTQWAKGVLKHFPEQVLAGVSHDGAEGPGSYGLNRNVTMTILVGTENRVTANFALVQPSVQADGPKVIQAIADVIGDDNPPSLAELEPRMARERMQARSTTGRPAAEQPPSDQKLTGMLRSLVRKGASEERVTQAAKQINDYVAENKQAAIILGQICNRIVDADKLTNYSEAARPYIKEWAAKLTPEAGKKSDDDAPMKKEEDSKDN